MKNKQETHRLKKKRKKQSKSDMCTNKIDMGELKIKTVKAPWRKNSPLIFTKQQTHLAVGRGRHFPYV